MKRMLLVPALSFALFGQQATPPAFEVASVKVSGSAPSQPAAVATGGGSFRATAVARSGCRRPNPGSLVCTNATLKMVLMQAYEVKNYQIEGPAWIDSEHFEVTAKIPEGVSPDLVPAMLRQLLADRFQLVAHKESKELPAYELTVARGGPKMVEVGSGEVAAFKAVQAARLAGAPAPSEPAPPPPGPKGSVTAMRMGTSMITVSASGSRTVRGKMDLAQLVSMLTNDAGRPVIDKTNLMGTYEVELTFLGQPINLGSGMQPSGAAGGAVAGSDPSHPQPDAEVPIATIFQAVQATLGLKLDSKKMPIDIVVVDSANKVPTEN